MIPIDKSFFESELKKQLNQYKDDKVLFDKLRGEKLFARLNIENLSKEDIKERVNKNVKIYKWAVISIKKITKKLKEYNQEIKVYHWSDDISPDLYIDDPNNEVSAFFEITTALDPRSAENKGEQIAKYLLYSGSKNPKYVLFLAPTNFDFQEEFPKSVINEIRNGTILRKLSTYSFNGETETKALEETPIYIIIKKEYTGELFEQNIDTEYPPLGKRLVEKVNEKDLIVYEIDQSPPIEVMLYLIRSSIYKQISNKIKKDIKFREIIENQDLININIFDIFQNIINFSFVGIEGQNVSKDNLKNIINSFATALALLHKTHYITDPSIGENIAIRKNKFDRHKNSEDFITNVIFEFIDKYLQKIRKVKPTKGKDANLTKFFNLKKS